MTTSSSSSTNRGTQGNVFSANFVLRDFSPKRQKYIENHRYTGKFSQKREIILSDLGSGDAYDYEAPFTTDNNNVKTYTYAPQFIAVNVLSENKFAKLKFTREGQQESNNSHRLICVDPLIVISDKTIRKVNIANPAGDNGNGTADIKVAITIYEDKISTTS